MSAEAYPDLGLEHNYCRNDPSIASFGFESYPRRLYDDFGAPHPLPRWYRVTTPAYVQTRTAPWHGMSKAPAWGRHTLSLASFPPIRMAALYTLGLEVRVAQQEQQAARSKHSKKQANEIPGEPPLLSSADSRRQPRPQRAAPRNRDQLP